MQRGEGMAPFADVRGSMAAQQERSDSSLTPKRDRSNNNKSSGDDNDNGRSGGGGAGSGLKGNNNRAGSKSRGNHDDDNGSGGNDGDDGNNHNDGDNDNRRGGGGNGAESNSKGGGNGEGNNDGSRGGGDSGNANVGGITTGSASVIVVPPPAITTTSLPSITTASLPSTTTTSLPSTSTFDPGSDSNGAQRLPSEPPFGVITTSVPKQTPTAVATTLTPVILSSSAIVTTGPNAVVTSFIPVITTSAVVESTTTVISLAVGQAGSFGSDFSGFSDLPKPTNKGDANDDGADRKHKGPSNSTTSGTGNKNSNKAKPLSPNAERALISVGSIGAFVIVCFLSWLVWRAFRKHKQKKTLSQGNVSSFDTGDGPFTAISQFTRRTYDKVARKVPFLRKQHNAWRSLEETSSLTSAQKVAPMAMVTSNLEPSRPGFAVSPTNTDPRERDANTIQTFGFDNISTRSSPPPSIPPQVYYSSGLGIQFQPVPSQSPPQQFEASNLNPNGAAGMPSDAYDPNRREVNRASELSSLSSGFGDGEMLMLIPEQLQVSKTETANDQASALPMAVPIPAEPMSSKGQFSWMRNTNRLTRETVYSEASEDQPAKFRTVDSWVKQQTGRVRRGQASIDATTDASAYDPSGIKLVPGHEPGIPHPLPEEQRLTMMMDDEEVPRRPDTLLVNGTGQQGPGVPK
ncbi:hypothetical protein F503_00115 [Ophiostoma piceae UAMH 11346]|uniref:Uncharacterized protein n=1 Tax=Ophiostoma piceae (strain UAMH 11346) TaxID=1262450 RepID=S3BZS8_OPHP1|nr:hypothetical protein F503_00115 [Ophiostoma piceae UAMH 11346]